MNKAIIIVGMGEMGGVFARAFLRAGHPVIPVLRQSNLSVIAAENPHPSFILLSVAEKDLHPSLEQLPQAWKARLCLIQNELLPRDWEAHRIENPTVISVWFEKKPGQDFKVIIPSPVFGPQAVLISDSLASLGIPCRRLSNQDELLFELIRKNVYILTTNISGLVTGGTVATLWKQHRDLATQVANDVIEIQDWLTGQTSNRGALIESMVEAFEGDPDHKCMGRSAPARLNNAITLATEAGLEIPKIREISKTFESSHTNLSP